jgi:hypothetical protein
MYANALRFRVLVTRLRFKYSPALNFTLVIGLHINSRELRHVQGDVSIGELADLRIGSHRTRMNLSQIHGCVYILLRGGRDLYFGRPMEFITDAVPDHLDPAGWVSHSGRGRRIDFRPRPIGKMIRFPSRAIA